MASIVRCGIVCLLACMAALPVRAETTNRPPRPPREYTGRVQMHEVPVGVAVPLEDARPDFEAPAAPPSAGPAMPEGLPRMPATMDVPPPARERRGEGANRAGRAGAGDAEEAAPSGWGWLADDLARNRAQRKADEAEDRARDGAVEQDDDGADVQAGGAGYVTNSTDRAAARANERSGDRWSAGAEQPAGDQASSRRDTGMWEGGWLVGGDAAMDGAGVDAEADPLYGSDPERGDSRPGATEAWQAPAWSLSLGDAAAGDRPAGRDASMAPVAADDRAEEPPSRMGAAVERSSSFDRASLEAPRADAASPWSAPEVRDVFAMPTAQPLEPTPIAPPSLVPVLPSSSPSQPSLGGMGSEAEKAPPKVLPW